MRPRFPIDKLKIDRAFINEITSDPDDAAIAEAIVRMAHSLKLVVVAEGVETAAQLATVRRLDCDEMQGYHFSRPLPVEDLERLLSDKVHLPAHDTTSRAAHDVLVLVDRDETVLAALQSALSRDGYDILTAQSPAEGFELLALFEVGVVVCDHSLAGWSGTEFLRWVNELHPHTVRILLTERSDFQSAISAINEGAVHRYYTKPWNDAVLRTNIHEAFRHYRAQRADTVPHVTDDTPTTPVSARRKPQALQHTRS